MTIRVEQNGEWKTVSEEGLQLLLQFGIVTWETIVEIDGKKVPLSHIKQRETASQPVEQPVEAEIMSVSIPATSVQSVPVPAMKPASKKTVDTNSQEGNGRRMIVLEKVVLAVCILWVLGIIILAGSTIYSGSGSKLYKDTDLSVLLELAENGIVGAQCELERRYYTGDGVEQDYDEALKWFRKAVAQDDVEAAKWFRRAAKQGDAGAQAGLGLCYDLGKGVEKDIVEAVKWFRKAAEQGDAKAQFLLGRCYREEDAIYDRAEAVKWFHKAAEQGHAEAQYTLGYYYLYGRGAEQDEVEAVKWWRKAAKQGYPGAQSSLTAYYSEKTANAIRQSSNNAYDQRESQLKQFKRQYPEYAGAIQHAYDTYGHATSMDDFTRNMRQTIILSRQVQSQ